MSGASQLTAALNLNREGQSQPHVLIALPSFSVGESLLEHYRERMPALEHRFLLACFLLGRIPNCTMIYICTEAPSAEVLDYYIRLMPALVRDTVRSRLHVVALNDHSARSAATKLMDQPDLIAEIRGIVGNRPALIEPWNVTAAEVLLAGALGVPLNGTSPGLWPLGFKSAGRRLFRQAGVPVPVGVEDVSGAEGVLDAIGLIRAARPDAPGVVIKHDESGAGDGNAVLKFVAADTRDTLQARIEALPDWYLGDLRKGGIVEELIVGSGFTSPSAQVDIFPDGTVRVLATHEQILGGDSNQVYMGCKFPANPDYAPLLAEYGRAVGAELAAKGALGRFALDFVTALNPAGKREVFALEVNLRKGGTTHPYSVLRNLVPGHYDTGAGLWITADESNRFYCSTDNMVDPSWLGLAPAEVIRRIAVAGLQFDPETREGLVLHMLSCLAIDGRFGLTAIARSRADADALFDAAQTAMRTQT